MSGSSAAAALAAELVAAGVRAAIDPRNTNPPCVLFEPPSLTFDIGCGATAAMSALLLVPGPGHGDAWRQLDDLIAQVADVIDIETAEPVSLDYDNPMPAYRVTFTQPIDIKRSTP